MPKTLNRYNRRRKTKTQRRRQRGGRSYQSLSVYQPGQIHNFDKASNNLDALDSLMDSKIPVLVRHHRRSCPHCEDFEGAWKDIENGVKNHPDLSAVSLDDWATDHMNKKHYSRHGYSVSGVPTVVMIDRDRVPNEHKGPNTVEALEEFLKRHGMQIKIVPIEEESLAPESSAPDSLAPESLAPESSAPDSLAPESLAPESSAPDSLAPEAPEMSLIDKVKQNVNAFDRTIESGVGKVKSALTEPINFGGLFSSDSSSNTNPPPIEATANAFPAIPPATPAPAPADPTTSSLSDNNQIIGAPQVPSIINGGKKHRTTKKGKKHHRHSQKKRTKRTKRTNRS
jgi:glutaredoxin